MTTVADSQLVEAGGEDAHYGDLRVHCEKPVEEPRLPYGARTVRVYAPHDIHSRPPSPDIYERLFAQR